MPSNQKPYNYIEPAWVQESIAADAQRRLSTKDRNILNKNRAAVTISQDDLASILRSEMRPYNVAELDSAIASETRPPVQKILQDERVNVMKLIEEADRIKKSAASPAPQSFMDQIGSLLQNLWTP